MYVLNDLFLNTKSEKKKKDIKKQNNLQISQLAEHRWQKGT